MFRNLAEDATIEIYFETIDSTGAPVAPSSAFTTSDFAIYKNGSATPKATTNGLTVTSPFNSEPGCHLLIADTSNDTGDSGFWTTGARYQVKFNTAKTVGGVSIDGRSVPRGAFGIQSEFMRGTDNAALASGVNVTQFGGSAGTFASGRPEVNSTHWGGTAVASAAVRANLISILGTALTETVGGYLTAAFKNLFDVATPVFTAASVNQSGDSFPRIGAPSGASVSADIAAVKTDTGNLVNRITSTLFSGITYMSRWLGALAGKTADSATLTEIQETTAGAGYNNADDSLQAIRDRGDAAWITGSSSGGLTSDQDAALTRIDTKTALITGAKLQVAGAVTPGGDITLVIGDDHLVTAESELMRTIADPGGALYDRLEAAESITFGAGRMRQPNMITGTVTAVYAANVTTLTIEIGADDIDPAAIPMEDYKYQIQRITSSGEHIVEVEGALSLLQRFVARVD